MEGLQIIRELHITNATAWAAVQHLDPFIAPILSIDNSLHLVAIHTILISVNLEAVAFGIKRRADITKINVFNLNLPRKYIRVVAKKSLSPCMIPPVIRVSDLSNRHMMSSAKRDAPSSLKHSS